MIARWEAPQRTPRPPSSPGLRQIHQEKENLDFALLWKDSGKKHAHCLFLKLAFCTLSILSGEEIFLQRCTFLELAHSKKNNKKWSWVESHPPLWLGAHRCERNPWGTTPPCPEIKSKNHFVKKKSIRDCFRKSKFNNDSGNAKKEQILLSGLPLL